MTTDEGTIRGTATGLDAPGSYPREQLAATLAHELRDPLAAILNSLGVLRQSRCDEGVAREACTRAERQARHMARVIENVLDLCRAEHCKLPLRREEVSLAAVIGDAVDTAGPALSARGHHLTVSLPPAPVSLLADPSHLHQVLTNLLTNAARYTDPGGEIDMAAEVTGGGGVVLRVRDNGMGIAPDVLPRIFDLFQQGDRPGNGACGGLGIGLALVKSLVELHGGTVAAHSQGPGTGSEFVVRLLAYTPEVDDDRVPAGIAAVLSAGLMISPWSRFAAGREWLWLLAAGIGLTAMLAFAWFYRARSARRRTAALDVYAIREICHGRRGTDPAL